MRVALIAALAAGCSLLLGAASASATTDITYTINSAFDTASPYTITGTITTDGATGTLLSSDFVSADLTLTDGVIQTTLDLTTLDASNFVYFGGVTATTSGLFFDFGSAAAFLGFFSPAGAIEEYEGEPSPVLGFIEAFAPGHATGVNYISDSVEEIATAPEPATWALMLFGVAGLGGMLRSRRRLTAA